MSMYETCEACGGTGEQPNPVYVELDRLITQRQYVDDEVVATLLAEHGYNCNSPVSPTEICPACGGTGDHRRSNGRDDKGGRHL